MSGLLKVPFILIYPMILQTLLENTLGLYLSEKWVKRVDLFVRGLILVAIVRYVFFDLGLTIDHKYSGIEGHRIYVHSLYSFAP